MEWIRGHHWKSVLFGGLALLGVVLLILAGGSSETEPSASRTLAGAGTMPGAITTTTELVEGFDASKHPDIEQFDCSPLLTIEDADYALGVEGQLAGMFEFAGGETCTQVLADNEEFWVRLEPGNPADFAPGSMMQGAAGALVADVGDDAIWFGGDQVSVITVFKQVDLGGLYYRILLSRPDIPPEEELELLTELAVRALPRFPGVVLESPEPQQVVVDIEPDDPAKLSYAANLLAKVADGEWTLGEGLVATLGVLAGETEASEVLRYPEMVNFDRSAVVSMAQDYLAGAPADDPAAEDIARLLSLAVPTVESLEQAGDVDVVQPSAEFRVILVSLVYQEDPAIMSFCLLNFGTSPCMDAWLVMTDEGEYTLYTLKQEFEGAWEQDQVDLAIEGLQKAVTLLEKTGSIPDAKIILNPHEVGVVVFAEGDGYVAHLGINTIGAEPGVLQHAVAYALAKSMVEAKYGKDFWLNEGMATYLAGVVHPDLDYEHALAPLLEGHELSKPLTEWGVTSWLFFEFLHGHLGGPAGVFNFDQVSPSRIASLFHQFAEALTDGLVPDIGAVYDYVPYLAAFWDLPVNFLLNADLAPPPFGIRRIRLIVEPGKTACMDVITSGDVHISFRPDDDGGYRAPWESDLPLSIEGNSMILITSTGPGFVDFSITRFVDSPDECTDPPPDPAANAPVPLDSECPTFCDPTSFLWNPNTVHIDLDDE